MPRISRAVRSVVAARALGAAPLLITGRLAAQYPLIPSPVFDLHGGARAPALGGYVSVRSTRRNDSTSFALNRGRVTVVAAPRSFVAIRLQGDFSAAVSGRLRSDSTMTGFTLTDAYVELAPPDSATRLVGLRPALVIGQFKQPFSLEYLTSFAYLRTANRSQVVDATSPKRDIGVMGQVRWSRYITMAGAVTNGEGSNAASNPDDAELVIGRLTLSPWPGLAIAGKLGNEGADHLRGYDARFIWRGVVLEGEALHRSRPLSAASAREAGGGYALAAVKLQPWLEVVYKWERYTSTTGTATKSTEARSTWNTLGINLLTRLESLRVQLDWVLKAERPHPVRNNELLAQVIANF